MINADEALSRVGQAEASGQLSASAAAAIRRWLTESPFAQYRPRLLEDIAAGPVEGPRRRLLHGARVRHRRAAGDDVSRRHERPQRPNHRRERPGAGRLRHGPQGSGLAPVVRHRPRLAAQLAGVRRALRPGAGRGRVQGLPVPRAPLHPPALVRRAAPRLRCRHHDHRLAQPAGGQRLQVLRGRPAARSSRPTTRGSSSASRRRPTARSPRSRSRQALKDGSIVAAGAEIDDAYIAAVVSESVSHARDLSIVYTPLHGVGETSVAAALATAGFKKVNILASQRTPDGDFPNVPGHVSNPENPTDPRGRHRRGQGHRGRPRAGQRPRRRPDRRGPARRRAIPRASGPPSTATRSACCSPRSS